MLPIFVYGTLLPDQPNFFLWRDALTKIDPARLNNACLYDMGMFPMLIEGVKGSVQGAVGHVKVGQYAHVLAQLDKLEEFDPQQPDTSAYRRVKRTVVVAPGNAIDAWVYVGNKALIGTQPVIASGDWLEHTHNTMLAIRDWWENWDRSPLFSDNPKRK